MSVDEEIVDSPTDWVASHIRKYVETSGRDGHDWGGVLALLLTTKGRKTGKLRRTALIYGQDGDRYLVVASNGGASKHPLWYLNLQADPVAQVQVGSQEFTARARVAVGDERSRLWKIMASIWEYDRYQARTEREIPLIILERA